MKRHMAIFAILLAALGCGKKQEVTIFYADALIVPMNQIIAQFEKDNPGIKIHAESHGSVLCSNLAKERSCDILAVADARIIKGMQPQYADWCATFATNEMVIAYSQKSKYGAEITADNWYRILTRPDVKFAHSNPEVDPAGYWTLILWQLADLQYPDGVDGKKVSEALEAARTPDSIRSDAHQMLHMIESPSGIDYCFVYKNQAVEQNLQIVRLPREINLGDPALGEHYAKAKLPPPVNRTGAPIAFAVTLLKKSANREAATKFLSCLLGPEGRKTLRGSRAVAAFNVISPPIVDQPESVPAEIRAVFEAK